MTYLPKDIIHEILDYGINDYYVLDDWVDENKLDLDMLIYYNKNATNYLIAYLENSKKILDLCKELNIPPVKIEHMDEKKYWEGLSARPGAIDIIKEELKNIPCRISWKELSKNSMAIDILLDNVDKIDMDGLSSNVGIIEFINKYTKKYEKIKKLANDLKIKIDGIDIKTKLNWEILSENSGAIELLTEHQDKIVWHRLSRNPAATDLIRKEMRNRIIRMDTFWLYSNPAAMDYILANYNRINWYGLSSNTAAIELIKENLHQIDWDNLSENYAAIDILKANYDRINWRRLSANPAIFKNIRSEIISTIMTMVCIL